jgi:hypothetical protein
MNAVDDPHAWMLKAQQDLLCIDNNLAAARIPWMSLLSIHSRRRRRR